jgi:pimeloyl-ACP methyl ester carboxylesterase
MELVELARRSGMRAMGRQWVRRMVHPERLNDSALIEAILDMFERKTVAVFEAQQRALLARRDATHLLPEIACPTFVLCGREDGWSPGVAPRGDGASHPGVTARGYRALRSHVDHGAARRGQCGARRMARVERLSNVSRGR